MRPGTRRTNSDERENRYRIGQPHGATSRRFEGRTQGGLNIKKIVLRQSAIYLRSSVLQRFLDADEADGGVDMKSLGVVLTRYEALALLRSAYGLKVKQ